MEKADIGLIGLGVMGQNLALNLANKGWKVVVWNRTVPGKEENVVEHFIANRDRFCRSTENSACHPFDGTGGARCR